MGYIITFIVSLAVAVLGFIVNNLIKENRDLRDQSKRINEKHKRGIENGIRSILRKDLIEYHDKYMELKHIPSYALENWNDMFSAYTDLEGNGLIKGMDVEIKKLPII